MFQLKLQFLGKFQNPAEHPIVDRSSSSFEVRGLPHISIPRPYITPVSTSSYEVTFHNCAEENGTKYDEEVPNPGSEEAPITNLIPQWMNSPSPSK